MSEEAQAANHASSRGSQASAAASVPARAPLDSNLSLASRPQMTATTPAAADTGKWRCESCTYENYPLSRKCTMCRAAKPVLGEDIFNLQVQEHASALPSSEACSVESVTERLKPLRISSPQSTPHSSANLGNKWSCAVCTYENWPKALRCAMCGSGGAPEAPAPPAPPPPPPSAARPQKSIGINDICNSVSPSEPALAADGGSQRRAKRTHKNIDWIWLQACLGVLENSPSCVEKYLAHGGDPSRALTAHEAALLNRASAFDVGHTLVHLAIRFKRQEILATLLSGISGGGPGLKRSPSYIAPDIARSIRSQLASSVRYKKGSFPCRFLNEFSTFSLPCGISELPGVIQEQLFSELLDREVQSTLEPTLINWSRDLMARGSRLHALWNRSAGDCLPDAVCQAALGLFDRDNTLRAAIHATLTHAARPFLARFTAWERLQAARLQYAPDEAQLRAEWARLVDAAPQPGTPLHQLHVFVLAHVLRRPLIVYGVDVVNSFRGEALGYAGFQGIYLPLLWEPVFCSKSPLCLGYTRGHFSALVPVEPYSLRDDYICNDRATEEESSVFLPLTDCSGKLLPVHFLTLEEMGRVESIVRSWTRAGVCRGGVLCARQAPQRDALCARQAPQRDARPLLQAQMVEEWLNHYRRLAQQIQGPFPPRLQPAAEYSSDPDTEEE